MQPDGQDGSVGLGEPKDFKTDYFRVRTYPFDDNDANFLCHWKWVTWMQMSHLPTKTKLCIATPNGALFKFSIMFLSRFLDMPLILFPVSPNLTSGPSAFAIHLLLHSGGYISLFKTQMLIIVVFFLKMPLILAFQV